MQIYFSFVQNFFSFLFFFIPLAQVPTSFNNVLLKSALLPNPTTKCCREIQSSDLSVLSLFPSANLTSTVFFVQRLKSRTFETFSKLSIDSRDNFFLLFHAHAYFYAFESTFAHFHQCLILHQMTIHFNYLVTRMLLFQSIEQPHAEKLQCAMFMITAMMEHNIVHPI